MSAASSRRLPAGLAATGGADEASINGLTHDGCDRDASLARHRGDAAVALVVEQDLEPMRQTHAHTFSMLKFGRRLPLRSR